MKFELTKAAALELLPDRDRIHVFIDCFGADWKRDAVVELIMSNECRIGTNSAISINHGLLVLGKETYVVQTKPNVNWEAYGI